MEKKKEKKIAKKNYFIVAGIYLIVILAVFYLASWYNTYQAYQKEIPVLRNTISEIKIEELGHYLMENPDTIIYLCNASDEACREFEVQFKKEILKQEWQEEMTYLNIDNVSEVQQYLHPYNTANFTLTRIPAFIAFENGKITAISYGVNGAKLTIAEARQFINLYQGR